MKSYYILSFSILSMQLTAQYQLEPLEAFRARLNLEDQAPREDKQDQISNEKFLEELEPQLATRSVEQVARYIKNDAIPLQQKIELLHVIISNRDYGFTYDDTVQLILDIANEYNPGSEEQKALFKVLLEDVHMLQNSHPLFIALENDYKKTVMPLLTWAMSIAEQHPKVKEDLQELKYRALVHAVDEENLPVLKAIHAFAGGITKEQASDLLWHIVDSGKSVFIIPQLKIYGADIDSVRDKKTPLIHAVDKGNMDIVEQLIQSGVDLNKFADPVYGTALQRAIRTRNVPMEQLLRKNGARE